jgi:glucuronate isomerase
MIGVNRRVYEKGVYQGQDLFDQRTSLLQYKELFNAFPDVQFPISVLTSTQNQELVAYSWIFPNVLPNGHWWYSNTPPYITKDLTERITAVPKTKLIGYYSDAYKLEFVKPKYGMYRRILANVLTDEFVRPGVLSETDAVALGTRLLRDNVREIFKV